MTNPNASSKEAHRLEVSDVSCSRDERPLFDSLSFTLEAGQILLLEGDNGSGKTTFLRTLCGMRLPDAGEIRWDDHSQESGLSEFYSNMLYLGHLEGIKRDLTALENLEVMRKIATPSGKSPLDALDEMGLTGYEHTLARHLSAGQRRRLALSRLLVCDACLWILDEPFTSLDRQSIALIERIVTRHATNGGMVVMTSHHDVTIDSVNLKRVRLEPGKKLCAA